MSQSQRTILLIFFSFQLLSVLALQQIPCNPENRPDPGSCQNERVKRVCGYSKIDCPIELCGDTYYNDCAACADPKVDYYTEGSCPKDAEVNTCSVSQCSQNEKEKFWPVCGFTIENGEMISKTFNNYCLLQEDCSFRYYTYGVCKNDREYCSEGKKGCTREKEVCAFWTFLKPALYNSFVFSTATSISEACSDPEVEFYIKGECGSFFGDKKFCLPSNRPEACPEEDEPVCGYSYTYNNVQLSSQNLPSACAACADPAIVYYEPGPCGGVCEFGDNEDFGLTEEEEMVFCCEPEGVDVICVTYVENGEEKKMSARDECMGCYYGGKDSLHFKKGYCPGDIGIRCENDNGSWSVSENDFQPVCAYTTENCSDSSCRKAYLNSRKACHDPSVIMYSFGDC